MATYRAAKCRLCRREGEKLFLKGTRCFTEKCAFERRGYAPGEHGKDRRSKETSYGLQLRMKQKTRRIYGVLERQFRNYFAKAESQKGVTGENLLLQLERRLDNIVFRMGFASSRSAARQLVRHRHFTVNERIVDIPSFEVKVGDEVRVRPNSKNVPFILGSVEQSKGREMMNWISVDYEKFSGRILEYPTRANIPTKVSEQLIVELYSK
ncbi:MAG: 30S ribosomal protein S4 [Candidatus Eisenbacteria bacterium]|uniref:Small ribosomal subunit protein uS4 n=1 Tax=Eiseniibacteriota bacterium TaxID=2212470 RepID=A0A538SVJ4_UNCEI|nr:MAG: 30S ribosomal protein S4 [Candidatus Eisenbacteria bacterium]TMQ61343.1 MAG: 30S ribosomal protein S4 [Candidatus Eisenbacteria bacterium]